MRLRFWRVSGALSAVRSARGRWTERRGLLLRLEDDEGRAGLGEASPLPGYSAETLAQCEAALLGVAHNLDNAWTGPLPAAARCALETAALDLWGQVHGLPLRALLGGEAPRPVPLAALVADEAGAGRAVARGIGTLKVKIGRPGALEEEVALLRALRRSFPVALRVDANGAFSAVEAPRVLERLADLTLELCEEPVAAADLLRLGPAALREAAAVGVPLALDESLQHPELAPLIDSAPVAALVLKPMALGVRRCLTLAERARRRGLGVVVTHLFDGPIGLALAAELALALGARVRLLPCGLDRHPGLALWPPLRVPQVEGAFVVPAVGAGLGVSAPDIDPGWPAWS